MFYIYIYDLKNAAIAIFYNKENKGHVSTTHPMRQPPKEEDSPGIVLDSLSGQAIHQLNIEGLLYS